VGLPIKASNAAKRWILSESEEASGLDAWGTTPDDVDFRRESIVRVSRARGRVVLATRREVQWSEVHYRAVAISARLETAVAAQEAIEAGLHDRLNEPGPEGTIIHYCEAVDSVELEEIDGGTKIYHRGVEFAVKVRPAT
jgi:hypothetical protein